MARKTPYVGCELEQEIIAKIGNNKTKDKVFTEDIRDDDENLLMSFYTYRHGVCIIDEEMMDVDFRSYSNKTKKLIHEAIMNDKYNKW